MHKPYRDIADKLGYTERQIRGWVNNHCAKKNRTFDESYFDTIDTSAKAYYLGYIYADGWISMGHRSTSMTGDDMSARKYEFGMQLQRQDRYVLESFNREIGGQHIIKDIHSCHLIPGNNAPSYTESSVLRVYSKRFVQSLCVHGISNDKTYSTNHPAVNDELFSHFLRGYFDGDGCVYANRHGMAQVHFTAYGSTFLQYIQSKLRDLYDIRSCIYAENVHKFRLVVFRYGDVRKLFNVLYANSHEYMLQRKYDKYTNLLGLAA